MNKIILAFFTLSIIVFVINTSIGQGINYQAALRNADGTIMKETNVNLSVTINDSGASVYSENISVTSDQYGLINAQIGVNNADFDNIDWSSGNHTLAVSIDGVAAGEVPFSVVPYAKTSTNMTMESLINVYVDNAQNGDILIYDDGEWYSGPPSNAGVQTLNLVGSTLSISGGNSINLSELVSGGDGWGAQIVEKTDRLSGDGTLANPLDIAQQGATNGQVLKWNNNKWIPSNDINTDTDDQTLGLTGTSLSISGGNTVNLSSIDTDTDDQILSLSGTNLIISEGNSINLAGIIADTDDQTLGLSGTTLSISEGNSVNLSNIDTDTDDQTLSLSGTTLTISDGNNVNLSAINTDAQTLTLNGNALSISGGNSVNLPASGSGDITGVTAGTGMSGGGSSGEVTLNANNTSAIWNADELQGFVVSDNNPNSGQALVYTGAEWAPSPIISQVVAGAGLSGGGSSGPVTLSAQTGSALWNANKIQGKTVEITNPEFGQVLAYDSNTDKFINAFQLDADFVPVNYGGVISLASLSPVVSDVGSDVNLGGVSGNFISGNPVGTQIAIDGNEIMAKLAEDVPGHLYLQNEGGQVSIGANASSASHILHVFGVARSTQSTWATSSDRRVKQNIRKIDNALDKILNLETVRFNWTQDYKSANRNLEAEKIGFVAQQVESVIPEMVSTINETYGDKTISDFKVLHMDPLFPLLVRSIQEQQTIIQDQQHQIDELKALVQGLIAKSEASSNNSHQK